MSYFIELRKADLEFKGYWAFMFIFFYHFALSK